jgi:hypothetical protein
MIGKTGKGDGRIDRVEGIDQSLVGTKQAGAFGVQIDPPGARICRTDAGPEKARDKASAAAYPRSISPASSRATITVSLPPA